MSSTLGIQKTMKTENPNKSTPYYPIVKNMFFLICYHKSEMIYFRHNGANIGKQISNIHRNHKYIKEYIVRRKE